MSSSFLTKRPGLETGRVVQPDGFQPVPEGEAALVLGSNASGYFRRFNIGDKLEIFQTDNKGTEDVLRMKSKIRGPGRMPAVTSNFEPWPLFDGATIGIKVDRGAIQTVTFHSSDFADITNATAIEVRDAINSQIEDAVAGLTGTGEVQILSESEGLHSRVQIIGGTAAAILQFEEWCWRAKLSINNVTVALVNLFPGEERKISDFAGNLAAYTNPITLRLFLELGVRT